MENREEAFFCAYGDGDPGLVDALLATRKRYSLNMKLLTMKSYALALACCFSALVLAPVSVCSAAGNRVLFVASNVVDMGDPEQHDARNNLWEYAPPFHVFVN